MYKNSFKEILVNQEGYSLLITLNRPESCNAITLVMVKELTDVLKFADIDDSIRVIIITGAERCFSAGGDLKAMKSKTEMFEGESAELRNRYLRGIQEIPRTIEAIRTPIIAYVNGPAVGAGCDLAAMCDLRVASEKARFGVTFSKIGLVAGDGGPFFLQRVVGYAKAMELYLTARIIDAKEAKDIGLVNYITEDGLEGAIALASEIASNAPVPVSMMKQALKHSRNSSAEACLELMASFQAIVQRTSDHFEGVDAILEKRQPQFQGK